jgi:hypothetical protein
MKNTENTSEFILGGIANDFRFLFMRGLSERAVKNAWKSSVVDEKTNLSQNAFYFTQQIKHETERVATDVDRDIQDVLESLRKMGFEFDAKTIKKGSEIEITNIIQTE